MKLNIDNGSNVFKQTVADEPSHSSSECLCFQYVHAKMCSNLKLVDDCLHRMLEEELYNTDSFAWVVNSRQFVTTSWPVCHNYRRSSCTCPTKHWAEDITKKSYASTFLRKRRCELHFKMWVQLVIQQLEQGNCAWRKNYLVNWRQLSSNGRKTSEGSKWRRRHIEKTLYFKSITKQTRKRANLGIGRSSRKKGEKLLIGKISDRLYKLAIGELSHELDLNCLIVSCKRSLYAIVTFEGVAPKSVWGPKIKVNFLQMEVKMEIHGAAFLTIQTLKLFTKVQQQ